jgi:hypothetical protein
MQLLHAHIFIPLPIGPLQNHTCPHTSYLTPFPLPAALPQPFATCPCRQLPDEPLLLLSLGCSLIDAALSKGGGAGASSSSAVGADRNATLLRGFAALHSYARARGQAAGTFAGGGGGVKGLPRRCQVGGGGKGGPAGIETGMAGPPFEAGCRQGCHSAQRACSPLLIRRARGQPAGTFNVWFGLALNMSMQFVQVCLHIAKHVMQALEQDSYASLALQTTPSYWTCVVPRLQRLKQPTFRPC